MFNRTIKCCPHCGRPLKASDNIEYEYQCMECDEDFYGFESRERTIEDIIRETINGIVADCGVEWSGYINFEENTDGYGKDLNEFFPNSNRSVCISFDVGYKI